MLLRHPILAVCLIAGLLVPDAVRAAESRVDFETQIAPILQAHCIRCHNSGNAKADLSLATAGDLEDSGAIFPGDPDASYLVDLITPIGDERPEMPQEGEPLSSEQIDLIRRWIADGAEWPEGMTVREQPEADSQWWSLQPLRTHPAADAPLGDASALSAKIDAFILSRLRRKGLSLNPPADRRTLIRRATYDLTGLPPTPAGVEAFVSDPDPDAYEKLIDRLLASPRYGERWGRHWLDVVRFGESNGFERNVIINTLWPFRDYVIESFNDDKPIDRLVREHLAGDVFGRGQPEVEVGSAFLVAGPYDDVGNQDPVQAAQIRANTIDEMIRATSEAFLGLTIGCARCHDHKFDPITQRDYYAWYATFAGVRHGDRVVATDEAKAARENQLRPLRRRSSELTARRDKLRDEVLHRGREQLASYRSRWQRPPVDRQGTEEEFDPVKAKFVRLVSEGQDTNPTNKNGFGIDEFEIWSAAAPDEASSEESGGENPAAQPPRNVALASAGAKASGPSRQIEDFPGAYGPQKAIDGKTGERFLATGGHLTIQLARPTWIDRVLFSSARGEQTPEHGKFVFVGEYRIEVSLDGRRWTKVADSHDRQPASEAHRDHRLRELAMTADERQQLAELNRQLAQVNREIAEVPELPRIWVGTRSEEDAEGPFHVFLGGSPQRKGDPVVPASLSALSQITPGYQLDAEAPESERRQALADWIVHPDNPITPRVLANRLWHYHFGTGIVDTPNDFGYMGGEPTHPELLDWLAGQVHAHDWRLKPLHKLIMMSRTYRQSSDYRAGAAKADADARLLWRYPPRRLASEAIRDTVLAVAGALDTEMGGPGFRLYRFLQDNVSTYVPLDEHGPETYRRAVYHQNVRASVVDLLTDFDQPDCAFSAPRRAETTTPLQALTMLNHDFTVEMARLLAERLRREAGGEPEAQIQRAYRLCYSRAPEAQELADCRTFAAEHGLEALCRVLLNTSELIYVR